MTRRTAPLHFFGFDFAIMPSYVVICRCCTGHAGFDHMTKPENAKVSITSAMQYLDTTLAPGSHVVLVPMVDGRILCVCGAWC